MDIGDDMFYPLGVKTDFSILKSLIKIEDYISYAKNNGLNVIGILDDNLNSSHIFYEMCKKNNIKPVIGLDITIEDKEVYLYPVNYHGLTNLFKFSSLEEKSFKTLKNYSEDIICVINYESLEIYENMKKIFSKVFLSFKTDEERVDELSISEDVIYINETLSLTEEASKYINYLDMINKNITLGEFSLKDYRESILEIKEYDTSKLTDLIDIEFPNATSYIPVYVENSQDYLKNLAIKGLNRRLSNDVPLKYKERLLYELDIINKMGFSNYFLIVFDYVRYAKKNGILIGPGRGSAVSSLVSYSLGITEIDPLKYNLLFERFLNVERITMPDIDIDFDAERRGEVIDYVIGRYGEKRVVGIITFNTLGAKQVIRDLGRVLGCKNSLIDTVARMTTGSLIESYKNNDKLKKLIDNSLEVKKIFKIGSHLEGLPRHVSVHAAGIVMSKHDIDEVIPLYKNQMGMYVSGYSKDYLEPLGLLKMDFLGISNLTMINEVIESIRRDTGLNITFNNIPEEDKKTLELFSKGDTDGIFQFESAGMISFLKKLRVNAFRDIVAAIALYRPGPMESIPEYLSRREGKHQIDYLHKDLESILKETYGIIIYQEQIMQIASVMAGYSLGEADILRRAMSKKKTEVMLEEREKFIVNSINRGYDKEVATRVYDLILKFANYGFNKSHAVAYSLISYRMAFLKTHFYSYFMESLLNNTINNIDKTSKYIAMIRSRNIQVVKPDINESIDKYMISDGKIICPLSIIRNVGNSVTRLILKEREEGRFTSFIDFIKRMYNQTVNRKVIESLVKAGSFDCFGYNKKTLIYNMDNIINYIELLGNNSLVEIPEPVIERVEEYSNDEKIRHEFELFGFYISEHPVSKYRKNNNYSTLLIDKMVNKYIELILEVGRIREVITKNNDVMAFINGIDEYGSVDLVLFPLIYKENREIEEHDIVRVSGRVEKRLDKYQLVVSKMMILNI